MSDLPSASDQAVAEFIVQLGRCAYGEGFARDLNPAQWCALHYLRRANRFSRTVSAFAEFHCTTRGTASQTIKSLVDKGYLRRRSVRADRRSFRLELTAQARKRLGLDPFYALAAAAQGLTKEQRSQLLESLQAMLMQVLDEQGRSPFGVCRSCGHLRTEGYCHHSRTGYECGFLDEPLKETELEQLCVNYTPQLVLQR